MGCAALLRIAKNCPLYQGLDSDLTGQLQHETFAINYLFRIEDFEERCRTFLEKRGPAFKGS